MASTSSSPPPATPTPTTEIDFSKKVIVIITGASKGIGRTIALDISRNLNQNSIMILLARSETGLEQTKLAIQEIDKSLNVLTHSVDLSKPDVNFYENFFDKLLSTIDTTDLHYGIIFHNAGSTGEIKQTTNLIDLKSWHDYFDLNLFSVSLLNSVFVRKFHKIVQQLFVINITSICGRTPFMNLAMYGCGKAARELFFKVFALEEPNITVLNYSPGPVDTDMFENIMDTAQSEQVRNSFKKVKDSTILTTEQTVGKLIGILEKGDYKSGDTIDYFDRI